MEYPQNIFRHTFPARLSTSISAKLVAPTMVPVLLDLREFAKKCYLKSILAVALSTSDFISGRGRHKRKCHFPGSIPIAQRIERWVLKLEFRSSLKSFPNGRHGSIQAVELGSPVSLGTHLRPLSQADQLVGALSCEAQAPGSGGSFSQMAQCRLQHVRGSAQEDRSLSVSAC